MMATASLAKVQGVSLREVYEAEDSDYLAFVEAVVNMTVEAREQIAREVERRSR